MNSGILKLSTKELFTFPVRTGNASPRRWNREESKGTFRTREYRVNEDSVVSRVRTLWGGQVFRHRQSGSLGGSLVEWGEQGTSAPDCYLLAM